MKRSAERPPDSNFTTLTRFVDCSYAPRGRTMGLMDLLRAAAVISGLASVLIALPRSAPLILRRMGETSQA